MSNFRKKNFSFHFFIHLIFKCYYCSINLKRQSEHSGLHPDTSSLVVFVKFAFLLDNQNKAKFSGSLEVL